MHTVVRTGGARRGDRLSKLASALDLLNHRIRLESQDVAVALALRARFGLSLPDIRQTQRSIAVQFGRDAHQDAALRRMHAALDGLARALTFPLQVAEEPSLSRPAARRAEQRALQLNASARTLLGAIAKAVAVGAAAAALYASPAAAMTCTVTGPTAQECTGDLSSGAILFTSPPVDTLTIDNLTKDITSASGAWGIALAGSGADGSSGAAYTTGDPGIGGSGVTLTVSDPTYKLVTDGQAAIIVGSSGGRGGDGGGSVGAGHAGDGGSGGNAGSVVGDIAIDISTTGDKAYGVVAISAGGAGGTGGGFHLGGGNAGDGGQGGSGGPVTIDFGPNTIVTDGSEAHGIYAISIGGDGGAAGGCGLAITCGTFGGGTSAFGGSVTVTTDKNSTIHTEGEFSDGILATSIGGFGGSGTTSFLSLGYAANGGSAGDGGHVSVTNNGAIQTDGKGSDGIQSQSIGGGGGNAGSSIISIVTLGGNGSQGGNGGEADATNALTGTIVTTGQYGRGIFAQSIGGGGGDGGAGAIGLVAIGGNGSGASNGGLVQVENDGSIATEAAHSEGIYAQSIGGGGGDGGIAGGLLAAIGGTAGGGGDGGKVQVTNKGIIVTEADQSIGILGMSVGGGGGNGGGTGGIVTVGGAGGDGGKGQDVTITNSSGYIQTGGYHSAGIMAQSVGGGGGMGGDATSVYAFIAVAVGGTGGNGGGGGSVKVVTDGTSTILTQEARSDAISAQSIGGGGGEGGYGAAGSAGAFASVSVAVGGTGGGGGAGGAVEVDAAGKITTYGLGSRGIFAQSIGGGGGDGGFAVSAAAAGGPVGFAGSVAVGGSGDVGGNAGKVTVDSSADILTSTDRATAIYAESVGGGGGAGGWSGAIGGAGGSVGGAIAVSVGGGGKGGGVGGEVTVTNTGSLSTVGEDAFGIYAQSVGGGGGSGGFSVAAGGSGGATAGSVGVSLGGKGDLGGDGGVVNVTTSGAILTQGDRATGVLAQSLGGGGGNGGFSGAVAASGGALSGGFTVSVGGFGGGGGKGGEVSLASASSVETFGDDAFALLAQSVGGGGGNGGFAIGAGVGAGGTSLGGSVTVGGFAGGGGAASTVALTTTGDIVTHGDRAIGAVAQSIGGGGGNGGFTGSIGVAAGATAIAVQLGVGGSGGSGGNGGDVSLTSSSSVQTMGQDSYGLFAQSVGGGGGDGGFSVGASVAAGTTGVAPAVNIGGQGGVAGDSGKVVLTSTGDSIVTNGDRAVGIGAQAIGGGGGNGGFTANAAVAAGTNAVAVSIGVGGFGAGGGDAGDVTLTSSTSVETHGLDAYGVAAQSLGGGGGRGGFSVGAAVGAGTSGVGVTVNVGGGGGIGGDAGVVTLTSSGEIITHDDRAIGIMAQSVGGGGGDGGFTGSVGAGAAGSNGVAVTVGIGGFGNAAGDGGKVILTSNGVVDTRGNDAQGLFAQSVGGGGGQGGFSSGVSIGAGQTAGGASLVMGGWGGAAGTAGDVVVTSTQQVSTQGDRSTAIQAQSIGGGGGSGGVAANFTGAFGGGTDVGVGLTVGGFGKAGGSAGDVTVTSSGDAFTKGEDAHGIYAQSVGGGGGNGGFSVGGTLSAGGAKSVALKATIGGSGGAGGAGGDVNVTASGITETMGDESHGIFAQSIGGGGGDGGWAGSLTGSFGTGGNKTFAISTTLGGNGGAAANAGDVTVTSNGQVLTLGGGSDGILAQSVGGGGGNGGMALSANVGATKAVNVGVSLGGMGGASGVGGTVIVVAKDAVETDGDGSIGIFAQSVGGGGGNGGAAGALAFSSSDSINLTTSVGGFAGDGSIGGTVSVTNSGTVLTLGEGSNGIQAQSVGGGGGHGGMAGIDETAWADYLAGGSASASIGQRSQNISVTLGGSGGKGEDAGSVTVINSGAMETKGVSSNVIDAESTGGGGGDGGVSTAASGAFGAAKNGTYSVAIGGTGGVAGNGGLVDVENTGELLSLSGGSHGIYAASIGGGGGAGGEARGFSLSFSTKKKDKGAVSVNVTIGGQGGASGDGGEVEVNNSGQIVTDGPLSYGVKAESIGGGGGDGGGVSTQGDEVGSILDLINKGDAKGGDIAVGGSGGAAGDGGLVTVTNSGVIWTKGAFSHGIFAQSVGGGGGNGGDGLAGLVSIGGQGAAAGNGGEVDVTNLKTIEVDGPMSNGIWAQSIGGGGGNGGATDYSGDTHYQYLQGLADTMNVVDNLILTAEAAQSFIEPDWGVGIGGFGGAAGNGGTVKVTNSGAIVTNGIFGNGIFAQSVGGGGGTGGVGQLNSAGQVVFSGLGGASGNGGDVTVVNKGTIVTNGIGAYGIYAQSVGGGGGAAGNYALGIASWGNLKQFGGTDYSQFAQIGLNPFNATGGNGGNVTVINTGDIILNGIGSQGIFAQSVGGGGGLFGGKYGLAFAGSMDGTGHGGKVTIVQNGNVIVTGKNSIGAFFQSASNDTDDDIVATINGALTGGSVYGKALLVDGGKDNTVTLNGLTMAGSNVAIVATGGNDTINANAGVIGNVDLGLGVNSFNNGHASSFLTLDYVQLNGGALTNAGVVTPGGVGTVQVTAVTGDYVQTSAGEFLADLDLAHTGKTGENDRLNISGAVTASGGVVLDILDPGLALPGDHTTPLFAGGGPATSSNLQLTAPVSAVATFGLVTTAHDVDLHYAIDFSPTGLNANQTAIGDGINAIQAAGSSPSFSPIAAELFYVPNVPALAVIYNSLSPETYADQAAVLTFASQDFANAMMSCPESSGAVVMPEHGCLWVKPNERQLRLSGNASYLPFRESGQGISGGEEFALPGDWRIGGAMSADDVDGGLRGRTASSGWRYQGGFVVKKELDGFTFDAAIHGVSSRMQTQRTVVTPGGVLGARGTQKLTALAGTFRAAYRFGTEKAYLKPMAEVSRLKIDTDGFTERGAGPLDLVIPEQSSDYTRVSAKLETGGEFDVAGTGIRPYSRIGVSHLAGGDKDLFAAAFAGAPAGVQGFAVSPGLDRTTLDAEAGVALVSKVGSVRFSWAGQYGGRTHDQVLAIKFTKAF